MSKAKTSTAPHRAHDKILQGRQTISLWILRFLRCLMLGFFPDARRTDGFQQKQTKETKSSPRTRRRKLINYDVGSLSIWVPGLSGTQAEETDSFRSWN